MSNPVTMTAEDHQRVSAAVGAAEAHTAGEIVTIVADRSDGYTDVALCWAAAAAFAAIAVFATIPDFYLAKIDWLLGNWQSEWTHREVLGIAAGIVALKFAGMLLIQLWQPLKFFLIPGPIKSARVRSRATGFFKVGAERRTHGRTGILIYLSMREHRAEIVADQAIAEKVDAEIWGHAMESMLREIRQGRVADGMIAAVEEVGKVLAEHFPRAQDDQNELPDRLIEI
jgi:putative membrane protein